MTAEAAAATTTAPALPRGLTGHPAGLAYLAFMEAFERFSFYGMQALLVLYMTSDLLLPGHVEQVAGFGAFRSAMQGVFGPMSVQALSSQIFGLYAGFASATPVIGGLIGDRWLGQRRAVLLGGAMMAAGHFLMAFEAPFLIALVLLMCGCGLLKGNVSVQVGNLYGALDRRREAAFQLFYLAANVGVFTAPLVCGTLGELAGWKWGFGAAGVGMLISLAIYLAGWRRLPPDTLPARGAPKTEKARLTRADIPALLSLAVLLLVVALFWVANGQVLNAYMLWAKAHLARRIGGFTLPVTWLQTLQAGLAILMTPFLIRLWDAQAARGREPNALGKMAIGCGLAVLGYSILALGVFASRGGQTALLWAVAFHLSAQTGYLFVYPIGMALFSRAAPKAILGSAIGIYFLSVFAGSLLVGAVGQLYQKLTPESFWLVHAGFAAAAGAIILVLWKPLNRALLPRPGAA